MPVSLQDLGSLMLALLTGRNPKLRSKPQYRLCHLLPALKRLKLAIPLWSTWSSLHFPKEVTALWPCSYKRYFLVYSLTVRKTAGLVEKCQSVNYICSHSLYSYLYSVIVSLIACALHFIYFSAWLLKDLCLHKHAICVFPPTVWFSWAVTT